MEQVTGCKKLDSSSLRLAQRENMFTAFLLQLVAISAIDMVPGVTAATNYPRAILEPADGAYFGVNINNSVSLTAYTKAVGIQPAVYVLFVEFPLRNDDISELSNFLPQVAKLGAMAMVTLEPYGGLELVTGKAVLELVDYIQKYEMAGVAFFLRFAHEMNGAWYPWGQRPTLYIEKFRLLAAYIRNSTCRTATVWAPNNGGGYPFAGGQFECRPGSCKDFSLLDTNRDGKLDMSDDMYLPYYPGDDAVDWVGQTLDHFGRTYPYGTNQISEQMAFYSKITGNYNGDGGDQSAIPDFYGQFSADSSSHRKPMYVPETSALFNVNYTGGASEYDIKQAWWTQVFAVQGDNNNAMDVSINFPRLKAVNWFDQKKPEPTINNDMADWTFSNNPRVREAFVQQLQIAGGNGRPYWHFLEDVVVEEGLLDFSGAAKKLDFSSGNGTVRVHLAGLVEPSEVGVDLFSVNEFLNVIDTFASGSRPLNPSAKELVVNIPLALNQSIGWEKGTLYYSGWIRPLGGNAYNRSDQCVVRSPFRPVDAERLTIFAKDGLIPMMLGWQTLAACLALLYSCSLLILCWRGAKGTGRVDGICAGAFRYAALQGNLAVLEAISQERQFKVDCHVSGFSALYVACIQGHVAVVQWLLSKGAKVQRQKSDKWLDTALHYAAANRHFDVARILLTHGAYPQARNFQEATPNQLGFESAYTELGHFLAAALPSGSISNNGQSQASKFCPGQVTSSPGTIAEPQIGFTETSKEAKTDWRKALACVWMFLFYYLLVFAGAVYVGIQILFGNLGELEISSKAMALAWALLVCIFVYPLTATVLPWHRPGKQGKALWEERQGEEGFHSHTDSGPLGSSSNYGSRFASCHHRPTTGPLSGPLFKPPPNLQFLPGTLSTEQQSLAFSGKLSCQSPGLSRQNSGPPARRSGRNQAAIVPQNKENLADYARPATGSVDLSLPMPPRQVHLTRGSISETSGPPGRVNEATEQARPVRVLESVISDDNADAYAEIRMLSNMTMADGTASKSGRESVPNSSQMRHVESLLDSAVSSFRAIADSTSVYLPGGTARGNAATSSAGSPGRGEWTPGVQTAVSGEYARVSIEDRPGLDARSNGRPLHVNQMSTIPSVDDMPALLGRSRAGSFANGPANPASAAAHFESFRA